MSAIADFKDRFIKMRADGARREAYEVYATEWVQFVAGIRSPDDLDDDLALELADVDNKISGYFMCVQRMEAEDFESLLASASGYEEYSRVMAEVAGICEQAAGVCCAPSVITAPALTPARG
ncbi:MAG: hypothetical protein H6855_05675 [Rhodospirillales bacterium]|nr:hypothetical protein [Rhodospirillales bacterium]MCB9965551.1 hypothetical protein [Rhodospirillales bacterium]